MTFWIVDPAGKGKPIKIGTCLRKALDVIARLRGTHPNTEMRLGAELW